MIDPRDVPVLLIVFNRPELTVRVMDVLREHQPTRLYIAGDGPRPDRSEADLVAATRATALDVDWPCEVHTLFQDVNLGCRFGVQAALDWFYSEVDEGIVLEDDVIPDATFFPFMAELLERYRDDPRVMMISGDYFAGRGFDNRYSYYFTRYTNIWGWATWRRAWQQSDARLTDWPRLRQDHWLSTIAPDDPSFVEYWTSVFDRVHAGEIDTWDYAWILAMWRAGGVAAQSCVNLVTNVGFGPDATHTIDGGAWQAELGSSPMTFPLRHPPAVEVDRRRDQWSEMHLFGSHRPTLTQRVTQRLRNLR